MYRRSQARAVASGSCRRHRRPPFRGQRYEYVGISPRPAALFLCLLVSWWHSGGMSIDVPLAAQLSRAMSIDMARGRSFYVVVACPLTAPGAKLSSAMSIDMAPGRSFYVVVACPLTCHSRRSRVFLRQRIGVAADAATRAECHVNGHGTTTRPHPLTCHSRRSLVVPCPLTWHRGAAFM